MAEVGIQDLPIAASLADAWIPGDQDGLTKRFGGTLFASRATNVVTAAELDLVFDGVTDQTKKLNDAITGYSALGGAVFDLSSKEPLPLRFNSAVVVKSGIHIDFGGRNILLGARGCVRIAGLAARTGPSCRLAADAAAGGTSLAIDRAASGIAGILSSVFSVGDIISITGQLDGAGDAIESQTVRVAAVTDGTSTLTLAEPLSATFKVTYPTGPYEAAHGEPNRTNVRKLVTGTLASDTTGDPTVLQLATGHAARFAAGDWISVEDEKKAGDVWGSSTNAIHREQAQVVAVDTVAHTVTLSRRILHTVETAYAGRVVKLAPTVNASVQRAVAVFAEAPDAGVVTHTFEIRDSLDCYTWRCAVPNTDDYGSRGNAFRVTRSINCGHSEASGRNPKYTAAGEGYGTTLYYCTQCWIDRPFLSGYRHHILLQGATSCSVSRGQLMDTRLASIDLHGCEEIANVIDVDLVEGGSLTASASWAALRIGNVTHLAGSHDNTIRIRRVSGLPQVSGYALDFVPPSSGNQVRIDLVENVAKALFSQDVDGVPDAVARSNALVDTTIRGCTDYAIDVDGGRVSAAARAHADLRMRNVQIEGGVRQIRLRRIDGAELDACRIVASAPSSTFAWGIDAELVTALRIYGPRIRGTRKALRTKNCPAVLAHTPIVEALSGSTVLWTDGGGCDGYAIRFADAVGFTATKEIEAGATPSTGTAYPPIGGAFAVAA